MVTGWARVSAVSGGACVPWALPDSGVADAGEDVRASCSVGRPRSTAQGAGGQALSVLAYRTSGTGTPSASKGSSVPSASKPARS
ncbi:hypothetical protein QFZ22_002477 [Streptomyces canus]|uniref:Secreted protein n=1 Tax=Streptomyces canus TaxID=58343 RepID=A0AAW8F9I5_9ACTN|nr:hypothetical protein [Streptomyces canus]